MVIEIVIVIVVVAVVVVVMISSRLVDSCARLRVIMIIGYLTCVSVTVLFIV